MERSRTRRITHWRDILLTRGEERRKRGGGEWTDREEEGRGEGDRQGGRGEKRGRKILKKRKTKKKGGK